MIVPSYPGFTTILVLTKSSPYGSLGPYELRDKKGRNMENLYQFSKIYPTVPSVSIPYTKRYPKIVWTWKEEKHIVDGMITDAYWKWREAGMNNEDAVRYPVGNGEWKKTCVGCIREEDIHKDDIPLLSYIESRKQIYLPLYCNLVQEKEQYKDLVRRYKEGENLLICETDGSHQESLPYYMEKYGVDISFIEKDSMPVTERNLAIMLDDELHPSSLVYLRSITPSWMLYCLIKD